LAGLASQAQTYTPVAGRWQYVFIKVTDGFAPPQDTLATAPTGAIAVKNGVMYVKGVTWVPISGAGGSGVWGSITGVIGNQTDLMNLLGTKYDTSKRKVDTLYAINDTTFAYYINSQFRSFKALGALKSFNGRNGAIVLTQADVSSALGFLPVAPADTVGRWVGSIANNATNDSIIYYIGGTRHAIKDNGGGGRFGYPAEDDAPAQDRSVDFSGNLQMTMTNLRNLFLFADSSSSSTGVGVLDLHKINNSTTLATEYRTGNQRAGVRSSWNLGNMFGQLFSSDASLNESYWRAYKDSLVVSLYNNAIPYYIHGLTTTGDTSNWKPLGINPATGEERRMTFWPGSGGGSSFDSAASQGGGFHTQPYNDARYLIKSNNLSDLPNAGTARINLGLGTSAVKDIPASGDASTSQVVYGTDTRLTNSRAPSGSAGGDLTGSYPSPTIAANAVTYAKMQATSGQKLLGSQSAGAVSEISLGTNLSMTGGVLNAASGGSQTEQQTYDQGTTMNKVNVHTLAGFHQDYFGGKINLDSFAIARALQIIGDSIVIFDNSIGFGTGSTSNLFRYTSILTAKYRSNEDNYSVGGTTMQVDGLAKIPLIPNGVTAKIRWFIIGYVENDIINAGNNATWDTAHCGPIYRQFVDSVIARGTLASHIILRSPVPISSTNFPNATSARQVAYFAMVQSVATSRGCVFVDVFNPINFRGGVDVAMYDKVLHPNDGTYSLIADLIYKAAGDSVRSAGQGIENNRVTSIRQLGYHGNDTVSSKAQILAADTNGKVGLIPLDDVIRSTAGRSWPQAASIAITGTATFGNALNTAMPGGISLYTPGSAYFGSMRITATPPTGWAGAGGNFSFNGTGLSIFNKNYTSSVDGPIYLNQFGGAPVLVGTGTVTGSGANFQVSGSAEAGSFRATSTWSGARTGVGAEIGSNGTVGYITALNSGGGVNLNIGFGLSPLISVGANTFTGTSLFQVNGSQYLSGKLGIGNSAPSALLQISGAISSPTAGRRGTYFSSDTATITYNQDLALDITHFHGRKTINQTTAHTILDHWNTVIEKDTAGTNSTIVRNRSLLINGPTKLMDSLLLGGLKTGSSSDSVLVWNSADSSVKKVLQSSIGGSSQPFPDNTALIKNNSDATKTMRIDLSGLSTATAIVATPPTSSFTMARTDAAQSFTGIQTFLSAPKLNSVASGSTITDSVLLWNPATKSVEMAAAQSPANVDNVGSGTGIVFVRNDSLLGKSILLNGQAPATNTDSTINLISGPWFNQTADATLTNSTSNTSIVGTGVGSMTFAANTLAVGQRFVLKGIAYLSTDPSSAPTLVLQLSNSSSSTALTMNALVTTSMNNAAVEFEYYLTVRSTGASGVVEMNGWSAIGGTKIYTSVSSAFLLNTTVSQTIDFKAQFGTASTNNTIVSKQISLAP